MSKEDVLFGVRFLYIVLRTRCVLHVLFSCPNNKETIVCVEKNKKKKMNWPTIFEPWFRLGTALGFAK
jgi:hypothetical protein